MWGIIISLPTKYKLLNGNKTQYKYLGSDIIMCLNIYENHYYQKIKKKINNQEENTKIRYKEKEIIKLIHSLDGERAEIMMIGLKSAL